MEASRSSTRVRWRAVAIALLAALALLAAGWGVLPLYRGRLIADAKEEMLAAVAPHVDALTVATNRRLSAVSALRAFALVDPSLTRLDAEFPRFVAELYAGEDGIRNLALAPGGVQTYVYPPEGNEGVQGHDLLADARAEVRADVARAIETGTLTLSGPYELRQGGLGLVARLAITVDGEFWGLVTTVLDIPPLLEDAGLSPSGANVTFALLDGDGRVFAGDEAVLHEDPVTARVTLPESAWTLAAAPVGGWSAAVHEAVVVAQVTGILLVMLASGIVFLLVGREERILRGAQGLARRISDVESWYGQTLGRDEAGWTELVWMASRDALRIAAGYLVLSALWIVLSDRLLLAFGLDSTAVTEFQTLKGWLFVAATATVLYAMIRRRLVEVHQSMALATTNGRKYRVLAENTLDVIWQMDLDGTFTYINPSVEAILGYEADEVVGSSLAAYAPDEDYQRLSVELAEALNSEDYARSLEIECQLRRRDGTLIPVEIRGSVIVDDRGHPLGLQGLARDMREREEAEREREQLLATIQEQVRLVERIIDTVPDGVLLLDERRRPTLVNPAAGQFLPELTGYGAGEIGTLTHLGDRALGELLAPPPMGLWHEVRMEDRVFEVVARPMVAHPVSDEAFDSRWVVVLHDATSEREIRSRIEEQARLSALGQMAAGIAHDFNNILAVVMLYTQMSLRAADLGHATRDRLQVVLDQAERASALVQQILDFGRRTAIELQETDLVTLLMEEAELLRRTMPESIIVTFEHGGGLCSVHADPRRLQQAVMNLAVNARDAMPGGGELRLGVTSLEIDGESVPPLPELSEGHWVAVTVEDTGDGIPDELVSRIFEPFFTTKGPGKGSGLGLAQVYGIIQQHGGHIGVTSGGDRGTRFTLYLPASRAASPPDEFTDLAAAPRGNGELVLLVEDHAATRVALIDSLELLNYRVVAATDGGEALAVLDNPDNDVAVVLSDYVMPEVDGRDLFLALKARGLPVPMMILTGHPMTADLDDLITQGLSGWLPKPPDLARLARLIRRVLVERKS